MCLYCFVNYYCLCILIFFVRKHVHPTLTPTLLGQSYPGFQCADPNKLVWETEGSLGIDVFSYVLIK